MTEGGTGIRLLHVDDDEGFLETVADYLRHTRGFEVTTATNVEEGLSVLSAEQVDCVVSDYDMPETDGLEFLRTVREDHQRLPFVLFTGAGDEAVASEAVSAGVDDYLRKEYGTDRFDALARRVETLVAKTRAESSYREIFDKSAVGLTVRDPETGAFVDVNEHYCELMGYSREEVLSLDQAEISAGESPYTSERGLELLRDVAENGPRTVEWRNERKDGEEIWVAVHLQPATIRGQERVLVSVREITEQKERQRDLERKNERLEEFASIVSHDLRNPLSVAQGHLELAREDHDDERLDAVASAHERMESLVEDLLVLANQGLTVDGPEPVRLSSVVADAVENVATGDGTVTVASDRTLLADPDRLQQLFENLIRNSVEHGSTNPPSQAPGDAVEHGSTNPPSQAPGDAVERDESGVTIEIGALDGVGFYVADDGPGIPPAERERVFEYGYSTDDDGTGFGLAIVRRVAEAHGWDVSATDSENGGARFEFRGVESARDATEAESGE